MRGLFVRLHRFGCGSAALRYHLGPGRALFGPMVLGAAGSPPHGYRKNRQSPKSH